MKFFSLIEGKEVHIAPDKKKIPSGEFSKLVDADFLLKEVKREEIVYRKKISEECEIIKEEAGKAGFEEGLRRWNEQIILVEKEIRNVRQEIENSLVPLALTAVKKIIGKELQTHPETIVDIVSTALKAVSQHRKIKIFVNPADLDTVEKARPQIKDLFEHLETLTIAAREDVGMGGSIIETEAGIINAQLESQLQALEAAFRTFFQNQKKR